jgi:plasmid stabilization system protein ParE
MARLPVDVHPEAVAEAAAAYDWYRERNEIAAMAFLAELDRAMELISEGSMRYPVYLHGTRRFLMRRFPFAVVYREVREAIQVVAIAHGRRKPGYWEKR